MFRKSDFLFRLKPASGSKLRAYLSGQRFGSALRQALRDCPIQARQPVNNLERLCERPIELAGALIAGSSGSKRAAAGRTLDDSSAQVLALEESSLFTLSERARWRKKRKPFQLHADLH